MRNFKWLLFLLLAALLTAGLNYALIPPNAVRVTLGYLKDGNAYDTLFLGTSHGQYGIDPEITDQMTGKRSLSLCMADAYPDDSYYLLKLACETEPLTTVVYELDPSYWMNEQRSGSTQIFFYREFPLSLSKFQYFADKIMDLDFRSTLAPWSYYRNLYAQILENLAVKQTKAYKNNSPSVIQVPVGHYKGRGFLYRNRVEGEDKGSFNHIPFDQTSLKKKAADYFDRIVTLCEERGISLIVVTTPVPRETLEASRDAYEASDLYFTELMDEYGLPYYNFNRIRPEILNTSMAGYWDYDGHMDGIQAEDFSRLLGQVLQEQADGSLDPSLYFAPRIP